MEKIWIYRRKSGSGQWRFGRQDPGQVALWKILGTSTRRRNLSRSLHTGLPSVIVGYLQLSAAATEPRELRYLTFLNLSLSLQIRTMESRICPGHGRH